MANETYYFLFSIVLVLCGLFYLFNLLFFRVTNRTVIGNSYKPGTPPYARLRQLANSRNILLTAIVSLVFIVNLGYDVHRLLRLSDRNYAHGILIYGPIACVLLSAFTIGMTYNKYGNGRLEQHFKDKKR